MLKYSTNNSLLNFIKFLLRDRAIGSFEILGGLEDNGLFLFLFLCSFLQRDYFLQKWPMFPAIWRIKTASKRCTKWWRQLGLFLFLLCSLFWLSKEMIFCRNDQCLLQYDELKNASKRCSKWWRQFVGFNCLKIRCI